MRRPFRGLRADPKSRYDAVVIGAGVGGLVCANLLAEEGLKVLLVEQHYMVGGFCSTFRRKGYTFDAGTHFYPLLGNPATITGKLLRKLGVRTGWVKMDPVDHFHFADGTSFSVPADFNAYLDQLKSRFPEEAPALDRFFGEVREMYLHGLLQYFRWCDSPKLQRFAHESVRQALDRHFRDPKLKLLLTADCPHWGSPPDRTSYVFDSMLRLSYFLGNYYPKGGSQAFADELARCFEERGGDILMSSQVRRILVEGGTARGVELETGIRRQRHLARVEAGIVVSNADLMQTYEKMVGPRHTGARMLKTMRGLRLSFPCYLVHIGLKGVCNEVLRKAQGYYWDGWDPDRVGLDGLRFKLFCPTLYEPQLCKAGHQILIVQKVRDVDYARVGDWAAHKREFERFVDENLEKVLPGIERHVEVKLSATALTSYRFTLNFQGAMLGWEMSPDQLGIDRPGIEGPVRNLYCTGHWTQPGGGITPVIVSAMRVADLVRQSRPRLPAAAQQRAVACM